VHRVRSRPVDRGRADRPRVAPSHPADRPRVARANPSDRDRVDRDRVDRGGRARVALPNPAHRVRERVGAERAPAERVRAERVRAERARAAPPNPADRARADRADQAHRGLSPRGARTKDLRAEAMALGAAATPPVTTSHRSHPIEASGADRSPRSSLSRQRRYCRVYRLELRPFSSRKLYDPSADFCAHNSRGSRPATLTSAILAMPVSGDSIPRRQCSRPQSVACQEGGLFP